MDPTASHDRAATERRVSPLGSGDAGASMAATLDVEAVSVLTVWEGKPAYQVIFRDLIARKASQASLRPPAKSLLKVAAALTDLSTFVKGYVHG